jgi:hypothetical protein
VKRRDFITLLGGAAAAWPITARAQQPGKRSRIGYLGVSSSSLEPHYVDAFRQKLRDLGYIDGETIAIEFRWAEGQDDRLPGLATELVSLSPDVIALTRASRRALTRSISCSRARGSSLIFDHPPAVATRVARVVSFPLAPD